MKKLCSLLLALSLVTIPVNATSSTQEGPIQWQEWSDQIFERAKKENKLVILDLEAVWCHWCHVMEETTYKDPKVVDLIQKKYIAVRVDQDARPDLSNRYEEYGWPATVVFSPDGNEIVKRRGYIPPEPMAALLQAIIDDPTPGPSVMLAKQLDVKPVISPYLNDEQRSYLVDMHFAYFDKENAGWGKGNKLIYSDNFEYSLLEGATGDKKHEDMARRTLDAGLNLLDPVWGGFYQYSDKDDWKGPHFEKIMMYQTQYIRLYALASIYLNDPKYLDVAKKTAQFLNEFWKSSDGAFYTSQDADVNTEIPGKVFYAAGDAERRKLGMPRIDKNSYARENGWAISALSVLYSMTGDKQYLNEAETAARWISKNRSLTGGGFKHGEKDSGGPYLGDTLYMAQAFLNLYEVTGDRAWLTQAVAGMDFIQKDFKDDKGGGFKSIYVPESSGGVFQKSVKQVDENIALARFAIRLNHYTGDAKFKEFAEHAMRYLASPDLIQNRGFMSGVLLIDSEISNDPMHVTVVGAKNDPKALELFRAALAFPSTYRRIEWWDKKEGPLPHADVEYPDLPKAAAFVCSNGACSLPAFEPATITTQLQKSAKRSNS